MACSWGPVFSTRWAPQRLEEELRLHQCSTRECIEQYYLDKLKQVRCPGRHVASPPESPSPGSPA